MKVAITFLALIALGYSAPQPRKVFHEHFQDFMDLIFNEVGDELQHIHEHYMEFEEFQAALDYMATANFRELIFEMEDLPEFKAVVDFLEGHNIDILYFIESMNSAIENYSKKTRHTLSGRDYNAYIKDTIAEYPKDKLIALYEEKIAEDEDFKNAMESLQSEEWNEIYGALWNSEAFLNEVAILKENGIEMEILVSQIKAVFGF